MAELRDLDPASGEGWDEFAGLFTQYCREFISDEPTTSGEEWRSRVRHSSTRRTTEHLVAVEDGRSVGAAAFSVDELRPESAWLWLLYVAPAHREQGIGTQLLAAVRQAVGRRGRNRLRVSTVNGHAGGEAFAARAGGRRGLVNEQSRCPVARLDVAQLQAWRDRAGERAASYSLVAFDGVCPDEHLDAFAAAVPIMNTAPRSEGSEEFAPTAEELRDLMTMTVKEGSTIWTVCAREDRTGTFVGYTELFFNPHRPWLAAQGDTGVHPNHRERGIGRWLKAETALRLLDERPGVEFIETWNASVNAAMLSINRAMGFEPVAYRQEWDIPVSS